MTSIIGQLLDGQYSIVRELKNQFSQITYLAEDSHHSPPLRCIIKQFTLSNNFAIDSCLLDSQWHNSLLSKIAKNSQVRNRTQIPKILDYFFWGKEFFLVREYIVGESLAAIIEQRQLGELELIHILQQVLKVLDTIHQSKEKHLNLKPSNIIFTRSKLQVFLTDLSLNRDLVSANYCYSQSIESELIEADCYLAPEQKQGKTEFSSDFYALGAIAIEALTGKSPERIEFQNRDYYSRASLLDRVTSERYSISSQLAKVLENLLQTDPKLRYQSVAEILPLLEQPENILLLRKNKRDRSLGRDEDRDLSEQQQLDSSLFSKIQPRSWLIILISSLTCSLLFLVVYLFSWMFKHNQPQFLAYQNKDRDISFEYPPGWIIKELDDPITGEVLVLTAPLENENDTFQEQVYVSIEPLNNARIDYETVLIDKIISSTEISNIYYQQASTKLANKVAHTMVYQRNQNNIELQQKEVFTLIEDKVYLLTYMAEKENYAKFLPVVNRIIKSFDIEK